MTCLTYENKGSRGDPIALITSGRENNHLNQMETLEPKPNYTNTMRMEIQQLLETSRRFSNSSPTEMEKEYTDRVSPWKKLCYERHPQHGWVLKTGKLNLIWVAATAFGVKSGMKNYLLLPLCLLLPPHPSGTAQGAFTLFTQARHWGTTRELNLGAEASQSQW